MRIRIVALALVLVVAALAAVPAAPARTRGWDRLLAPDACPLSRSHAAPVWEQRRAILCLIDAARARAGVRPLPQDARLDRAAAIKDGMLARCDEFTHTPCGVGSFVVGFRRSGYLDARSYRIGENLAWAAGPSATPASIVESWLESPRHRENMLDPGWSEQGLAGLHLERYTGHRDVLVWTSTFGHRPALD